MKTVTCVTTLLLALAGPAAQAQQLRPGLWEHQMTMKTGSGELEAAMAQMQAQLAAMPPEKRKQIEEAMKAQGMGTGMPGAGPGMSLKVCLTPEQAARNEVPQSDPDGQCKQTQMSRSGKTVKFKMECTGERKASGEGEFTLISDKEHQGRIRITSARKSRDETMEMQTRARWLAADCGDVKPRP
ncbi:MAG: DUF3617 domain-containing protein [Rubrivivax sp.]|nr:DUF3617 domain-containing protein [Rubrivivax sp.]